MIWVVPKKEPRKGKNTVLTVQKGLFRQATRSASSPPLRTWAEQSDTHPGRWGVWEGGGRVVTGQVRSALRLHWSQEDLQSCDVISCAHVSIHAVACYRLERNTDKIATASVNGGTWHTHQGP